MKRYPLAHRVIIPQPYTSWEATDIRKTIAKQRAKLKAAAQAEAPLLLLPAPAPIVPANVQPIRKARK